MFKCNMFYLALYIKQSWNLVAQIKLKLSEKLSSFQYLLVQWLGWAQLGSSAAALPWGLIWM